MIKFLRILTNLNVENRTTAMGSMLKYQCQPKHVCAETTDTSRLNGQQQFRSLCTNSIVSRLTP